VNGSFNYFIFLHKATPLYSSVRQEFLTASAILF